MGYESRFYIVNKLPFGKKINGKQMFYAEKIAAFDMSVVRSISDVIRDYPKTDCYIYADDGNTEIVKDDYDEELTEISVKDLIEITENAIKRDDYYRRYAPFLNTLKGFNTKDWDNLVVLHYGY